MTGERDFADVRGRPFALADGAVVRVAHPLHLGESLAAWSELFADQKILQPFAQLDRPVFALTEQERAGSRLTRFEGRAVPVGKVLGLVNRSWQRAEPWDGGVEQNITRMISAQLYLTVDLEPGIPVGSVTLLGPEQTLSHVYLSSLRYGGRRGDRPDDPAGPRLGDLDPITASELLGDLTRLTD